MTDGAQESLTDAIKAVATGHARARRTAEPVRSKPSLTDAMKDVATRGGRKPPATRAGRRGIVIYVEPEVADAIRRLAAEFNTTVQALGVTAFELLFDKLGEPRPG
jgi:hypothetical protein